MEPIDNAMEENSSGVNLLWVGVLVEGGLILLAIGLSTLGLYAPSQPLERLIETDVGSTLIWGALATVPMLVYLVLFHFWHPKFYLPMRRFVDQTLRPMFAHSSWAELVVISLAAGIGEEIFFRWCLQGGLQALLAPTLGILPALLISLFVASVFFGLCHWVNGTYLVVATLAGAYFGWVMWYFDSWLVAAAAHAFFDFIALVYLQHSKPTTVIRLDR